jgi:hypothetical protein
MPAPEQKVSVFFASFVKNADQKMEETGCNRAANVQESVQKILLSTVM